MLPVTWRNIKLSDWLAGFPPAFGTMPQRSIEHKRGFSSVWLESRSSTRGNYLCIVQIVDRALCWVYDGHFKVSWLTNISPIINQLVFHCWTTSSPNILEKRWYRTNSIHISLSWCGKWETAQFYHMQEFSYTTPFNQGRPYVQGTSLLRQIRIKIGICL